MNKAVFIDKDGVIVDNSGYPEIIPTNILLKDNILEGLRYIKEKGFKLIIISNQPWISKGRMKKEEVENVFINIIKDLKDNNIEIDDYFYCPHKKEDNCECKKPKPKMIFDAAIKHNIDLNSSYMIGDMADDILAGKNANIKTILVLTGRGKDFVGKLNEDYVIKNINEIYKII